MGQELGQVHQGNFEFSDFPPRPTFCAKKK